MRTPCFKRLEQEHNKEGFKASSCATFMHPKPFFYKYYWWVFWKESPCDGKAFLHKQYRLSTKQAFDLRRKLESADESYWLYNERLPRLDPVNTPFDPEASQWKNTEWAKAFDEDPDEIFKGFK
jgi:hypothetical protein